MSAQSRTPLDNTANELPIMIRQTLDRFLRKPLISESSSLIESFSLILVVLRKHQFTVSKPLLEVLQAMRSNLNSAVDMYQRNNDFELYFWYIVNLSDALQMTGLTTAEVCQESTDQLVSLLVDHEKGLKEDRGHFRKERQDERRRDRRARLAECNLAQGIRAAGRSDSDLSKVYCLDVTTGLRLEPRDMPLDTLEEALTPPNIPPATSRSELPKKNDAADPAVPVPSGSGDFPFAFIPAEEVEVEGRLRIFRHGTIYGFARAPNGVYKLVFGFRFTGLDDLTEMEHQAALAFAEFFPCVERHGYRVTKNHAQNAQGATLFGKLWSAGWRGGRRLLDNVAVYAAAAKDKVDPSGYMDMYQRQTDLVTAWRIFQEALSPRAVMSTESALKQAIVPMFGSNDSDIASHGPSLGSNMAVGKHDDKGFGFANGSHTDNDIDQHEKYRGKVFTFGFWLHTNTDNKLVKNEDIRKVIPKGYFVLPGYRVAFDLSAATALSGFWRGGIDHHFTSMSKVDINGGITRWGASIQTNKSLPARMLTERGNVAGLFDRLADYYGATQ